MRREGLAKSILMYSVALVIQAFVLGVCMKSIPAPNIILALTAAMLYTHEDRYRYMALGILSCLVLDITQGFFIGIGMISMIAVVIASLIAGRALAGGSAVVAFVYTAAVTFTYYLVYWLLAKLAGSGYGFLYAFRTSILPQMIMCAVIALIIFLATRRKIKRTARRNWYYR